MKIDILCTDGSPLGVTPDTLWGDSYRIGVGGAEQYLITLCEEWTKRGYEVVLYNDPKGRNEQFLQLPCNRFETKGNRDALIIFRSPNPKAVAAKGKKIWLSCDQSTIGDFSGFSKSVDDIVLISKYHQKHFSQVYGISNTQVIDIPVRTYDYDDKEIEKIPNRLLFSSVPDRGLTNLWRMWPKLRSAIPEISLTITSDYRLWGASDPRNNSHRAKWVMHDGFEFIGAVARETLIIKQLESEIMLYPSNYEELFCIAVSEAQYAGVYPITSFTGALKTTNMGTGFDVNANDQRNDTIFIDAVVELLQDRERLLKEQERVRTLASERFSPELIMDKWDKVLHV